MTNEQQFYALWHACLRGEATIDQNTPTEHICGRYRLIAARTKVDHPVAIWPVDGKQVVRVGKNAIIREGDERWQDFLDKGWLWCRPVTLLAYDTAVSSGVWGDGKPARKGDDTTASASLSNEAPVEEALADQIAALAVSLAGAEEPSDQENADTLSGLIDRMRSLLALAEAERVKEKAPHLLRTREIDTKWAAIADPGAEAYRHAEGKRRLFLQKKQAELDALAAMGADPNAKAKAGSAHGRRTGLRTVRHGIVVDAEKLVAHLIETEDANFTEYLAMRAQEAARAKIELPGCKITITKE